MQQLTGFDAMFLYTESATQPMQIGALGIYDQSELPGGTLRFKQILENVEGRLHLSSVFRRRLVRVPFNADHPYWVDDPDFDLEYHIRHIALPEPRDRRQLNIEAARLFSRRMDTSRPLWEWWVIEGLDNVDGVPPGSFAVLFKIHHAAVDGKAGREMIDVPHDRSPEPQVPAAERPWTPERVPTEPELLALAAVNMATQPFRLLQTMIETLPLVKETLLRGVESSPMHSEGVPETRFNAAITAHRVHDTFTVPLDELKHIRPAVPGSTVNDVVLAIVGGGLRHYLAAHDELPEESLITGCPISIRPEAQHIAGGNQVAVAMVPLATDIADPLERLAAINAVTTVKKEFTHAVPAHVLTDYAQYVPGTLTMLAARASTSSVLQRPGMNTIVTNVPGWKEPLWFCGARMLEFQPFGPVANGMGLIHPVSSYLGDVTISIDAARELLPDPDFYRECLRRSYDELLAAARAATAEEKRTTTPVPA